METADTLNLRHKSSAAYEEDFDDGQSSLGDLFENDVDDPTYIPPSDSESDLSSLMIP